MLQDAFGARIVGVCLVRPINEEGLPNDIFLSDNPPIAAVIAVVPIVSHHEDVPLGHDNRAEIVP